MSKDDSNTSISDGSAPYQGWDSEHSPELTRKKRRRKRRAEEATKPLSINSLMDIVTIILVYLLKSYATSPIDVKDPAINLPVSSSSETVEEATVVMITGLLTRAVNPDVPGSTITLENTPTIVVDGKPVVQLDRATYRVPADQKAANGYIINALRTELGKAKKMQELSAEASDRGFTGKVVILADRLTPFRVLTEILVTCGEAGFGEFKFAIVKSEG